MCAFDTAWFNYFLIVEHGWIWASQVVLVVKNMPAYAEDIREAGSIPRWRRFLREGNGSPLQFSSLENPMDRGAWWAIVHRVAKSWTRLKRLSMNGWIYILFGNSHLEKWKTLVTVLRKAKSLICCKLYQFFLLNKLLKSRSISQGS